MGTRSAVGIAQGDGWKGRYCHWDGYPSGVGLAILEIHRDVCESDWEKVVNLLTEQHTVWSSINAEADNDRNNVPGVGESVDDLDEWIDCNGDNWGTEWAYVLTAAGVTVLEAKRNGGHAMGAFGVNPGTNWGFKTLVRWDDPVRFDLMARVEG